MTDAPATHHQRQPATGLDRAFASARPILVCYVPLGDPAVPVDIQLYLDEGVDVLEIGVPAPTAELDGPVIADSMRRARHAGVNNATAARLIARLRRQSDGPASVWMTYPSAAAEPGWSSAVASSGVSATLVAGAGPGEHLPPPGVDHVVFVSHRPTPREIEAARGATGYVMVAAHDGVTGARSSGMPVANSRLLGRLRDDGITVPLLLGFGISTSDDARRAVDCGARGVVVGSAAVSAAASSEPRLRKLLRDLRRGLDG